MGLLGLLFNIVTFPGTIVNGIVQSDFERRYGAPVRRFAIPEGVETNELTDEELATHVRVLEPGEEPRTDERVEQVVDYEAVTEYRDLFGLVLGPFFVTSLVALVLFTVAVAVQFAGFVDSETSTWLWLLVMYPGFVTAAHAFPNAEPTDALWTRSGDTPSGLRFVGYPLVAVSKLMSLLRFLWIDAIYAIGLYLLVAVPFGLV